MSGSKALPAQQGRCGVTGSPPAGRERRQLRARSSAAAILAVALVGFFPRLAAPGAPPVDPLRRSAVVEAVERASPAVVNISTERVIERLGQPFPFPRDPFFEEFFRDFLDPRPRRFTQRSLGSGVIIRPDGTVLTNEHVIVRASRIHVTLADGREFDAKLIGADSDSDLAVLHIDTREPLPYIAMGRSDDLLIGETVIAIGNPFGLSHTVTTGVVSATHRSLHIDNTTYTDFIQTDASINPGNSGGPLLNIRGELIGINTAIYSKAQGIGFAIPVDHAKRIVNDLLRYGEVQPVWAGLAVRDLPRGRREGTGRKPRGRVVVVTVDPGSPAARAGVRRGDLVLAIDGRPVASREEFEQRVQDHAAGEQMELAVERDGRRLKLALSVAPMPAALADELAWRLIGVAVRERWGRLVVTRVRRGSPAAEIGVEPGDRLEALGGTPVKSRAQFRRRMMKVRASRHVLLGIGRGPYRYNVTIPLATTA